MSDNLINYNSTTQELLTLITYEETSFELKKTELHEEFFVGF